jgi:hypothetical protein
VFSSGKKKPYRQRVDELGVNTDFGVPGPINAWMGLELFFKKSEFEEVEVLLEFFFFFKHHLHY